MHIDSGRRGTAERMVGPSASGAQSSEWGHGTRAADRHLDSFLSETPPGSEGRTRASAPPLGQPPSRQRPAAVVPAGFVRIAAGEFAISAPPADVDGDAEEVKQVVRLTCPFFYQATPVTQRQWQALMGSTPSIFLDDGPGGERAADRPVEYVNWFEAAAYCNRLSLSEGLPPFYVFVGAHGQPGTSTFVDPTAVSVSRSGINSYRLPTEAEQQRARIGSRTLTAGQPQDAPPGPGLADIAWFADNSEHRSHPVGQLAPTHEGVYDTLGNVSEWANDFYTYRPAPPGAGGKLTDPTGPANGNRRVATGGHWDTLGDYLSAASRDRYRPSVRDSLVGFRPARFAADEVSEKRWMGFGALQKEQSIEDCSSDDESVRGFDGPQADPKFAAAQRTLDVAELVEETRAQHGSVVLIVGGIPRERRASCALSLNIDARARPHVWGDITDLYTMARFKPASIDAVVFEYVPIYMEQQASLVASPSAPLFFDSSAYWPQEGSYRFVVEHVDTILKPGGRLLYLGSGGAARDFFHTGLSRLGYAGNVGDMHLRATKPKENAEGVVQAWPEDPDEDFRERYDRTYRHNFEPEIEALSRMFLSDDASPPALGASP